MKKRIIAALMVLAAVTILAATAQATGFYDFSKQNKITVTQAEYDRLLEIADEYERLSKQYKKLELMTQAVQAYYWQEPDIDSMMENAASGLMYGLEDPYTFYYSPEAWKEMQDDDIGEYGGIGIQMLGNPEDYSVTITRVFMDTPAEKAGVRKGDQLVRVEDVEVNAYTMQDAVNIMRGQVGGMVEIEVKRGGEYLTFTMERAQIHVNRIAFTMLEDQIGYIAMYEFAGESDKEFRNAYDALKQQGAKALIVDLRDNGGGWVNHAVGIADIFVDQGVLVYYQYREEGDRENLYTTRGKDDIPLLFLVNGNTASSSEILAGSLQALGRATVVGTKTFGKGIVQSVIAAEDYDPSLTDEEKWGFQLTVAQYFLANDTPVHGVGITPDIISEMPEELESVYFQLGDRADPQLEDAWQAAKAMIAQ